MNRHLFFVANCFYATAGLLGLPSLITWLWCVWHVVQGYLLTPPAPSRDTPVTPNSLVGLLELGARAFGSVFQLIGAVGQWALLVLTAVMTGAVVLALCLFLTGRGLHAQQTWARIAGSVFAFVLLLLSIVLSLSVSRRVPWLVLGWSIVILSMYSLWALWQRTA